MLVLELLHFKMEFTVSEPCDFIRVGNIRQLMEEIGEHLIYKSGTI